VKLSGTCRLMRQQSVILRIIGEDFGIAAPMQCSFNLVLHLRFGKVFIQDIQDALDDSKAHKLSYIQDSYRMPKLIQTFGQRSAETITPLDIERWLSSQAEENKWKPATVNRFKTLLSLVFRLGVDNGKQQVRQDPESRLRDRFVQYGCFAVPRISSG
jgi:hypothetical protein